MLCMCCEYHYIETVEYMLMDYRIACSLNGWTDGELAVEWMVEDFDRQTKEKADGKT